MRLSNLRSSLTWSHLSTNHQCRVRHANLLAADWQGLPADVGVSSSVISVCARAQQLQHAITVFKHLHQRGLKPEATAFNALLQVRIILLLS